MSWAPLQALGDLCEISHGSTPSKSEPRYWGGDLPWVSPKDMHSDLIGDTEDHLTSAAMAESRAPVAPAGSVLIVVRSGILVRRLPVALTTRDMSFNQDIKTLVPDTTKLRPKYLLRFLQSRESETLLCGVKKGATVHSVVSGYIESLRIPLPSAAEQDRIVELLDQANALRRQRAEADAKLARLLPALFRHHFGDPARYPRVTLQEIGDLDRGRSRHRPRNDPQLYGGPYPFIQTGDVAAASGGWILGHQQTYSEAGLAQSRLWPRGTLCITIAANIAETAVLGFDACFPDSIVGFTPKPGISIEFVQAFVDSTREQLTALAPQAAQKNINLEVLRNLEVPLPPSAEQNRFAAGATEIRELRTHASTSAAKLETLFQTLLHRAFTGELTAKWREQNSGPAAPS